MGNLPVARTQTFDDTTPVASAVLNELEDAVIAGLYNTRAGRPVVMPMGVVGFTQKTFTVFAGVVLGGSIWQSAPSNCGLIYSVPTEEGDTLAGIALDVLGTGQNLTLTCYIGTPAQFDAFAGMAIVASETYAPVAGWQRTIWQPGAAHAFTAHRMLATEQVWVAIQVNTHAGIELAGVRPLIGRLP